MRFSKKEDHGGRHRLGDHKKKSPRNASGEAFLETPTKLNPAFCLALPLPDPLSQNDLPVSSRVLSNPENGRHTPSFYELYDREKQLPQDNPDLRSKVGRITAYAFRTRSGPLSTKLVMGKDLGWGNEVEEMLNVTPSSHHHKSASSSPGRRSPYSLAAEPLPT